VQWLEVAARLIGFPRHLSQHVGGFVLTQGPAHAPGAGGKRRHAGRTVIQWDKDDLDAVGLLKVDVLALGMLSAIRRCLALVGARHGVDLPHAGHPRRRPRHLGHDLRRRHRGRVPDRKPRADEHAAAPASPAASTTW
jgi:error-prone DNA polymerase